LATDDYPKLIAPCLIFLSAANCGVTVAKILNSKRIDKCNRPTYGTGANLPESPWRYVFGRKESLRRKHEYLRRTSFEHRLLICLSMQLFSDELIHNGTSDRLADTRSYYAGGHDLRWCHEICTYSYNRTSFVSMLPRVVNKCGRHKASQFCLCQSASQMRNRCSYTNV
jgi:hypothetical protein